MLFLDGIFIDTILPLNLTRLLVDIHNLFCCRVLDVKLLSRLVHRDTIALGKLDQALPYIVRHLMIFLVSVLAGGDSSD